jgi:hypothetical protein
MTGTGSTKQPSDKAAYVPSLFSRVKRKTFSKIGPKVSKPGKSSRHDARSPSKPLRTKQELVTMHRVSPKAHNRVKLCCIHPCRIPCKAECRIDARCLGRQPSNV